MAFDQKKVECCDQKMSSVDCYDSPNKGVAFNLFLCNGCGAIYKQNVWNGECVLIDADNKVIFMEQVK